MLKEIPLKHSYSTGYDEPKEFFTEALLESKKFDLGLGFFSSSGIRSLSYGFAHFIANGGKMRVIINHILSEADKIAIEKGQNDDVDFELKLITDINNLITILSKEDVQFFKCFSYLIKIKRIEFVATVSTKGGIGHDKYGIFTDSDGSKIAFIGSANFSSTALELNGETITAFSSWEDEKRVIEYEKQFEESWRMDNPHLIRISMDRVKTHIMGKFPTESLLDLIKSGIDVRDLNSLADQDNSNIKPLSNRLIEKMDLKEREPRFPFVEEREIQIDAYSAWVSNNFKGIFAMATGSGKTVTALNCLLKQYREYGFYKAIIVVPTQSLAIQWENEVRGFNFKNIVSTHTDKDWKNTLNRYITRSIFDSKKNLIVVTTYATFNRADMQHFINKTVGIDSFIYVADEAHNLGSPISLKNLPDKIKKRIGLSATPERVYDEIGSSMIYDFFNSYYPEYTYRYTMKQAIEENILCHYDYYPIFIELTSVEMNEYERITRQLSGFIDSDTGKYTKDAEKLLLKRKRIVHKAENKKIAITNLLNELNQSNKLEYAFVFVPEGFEPDYSEKDNFTVAAEDIHIIDEYAAMFKENGYSYHKYISGLEDAKKVLQSFENGDVKILLSMKCLDEGVDIPRAEYAIFCSSTGNPRQFVQRRGRVLRKSEGKEKAKIWDLVVTPPNMYGDFSNLERNLFLGEVKRIVNFASLADNNIDVFYGELKRICEHLTIDLFSIVETEYESNK